ncbi:phosphonate ABC transporter, permease protein PhnE [Roseomonas sp. 18066]|uniref:phosphonate ABC transporter, permease protein PhnE n=1 Tax=Roseomonas sp. 18066 TaxID=2681412 RepID=UPI001F38C5E7|nr:phosphonate ABC transporter, permease protein PhnE [Roseomonas sp. 18066]
MAAHMPVVQRGEAAYQALRRQRRNQTLLGLAVLAAALLLAARISEFYPSSLLAGLPRIGEYFAKVLPSLTWQNLLADWETEGSLAFWFYRLDKWALLLLQTAQMAALATLGGAAVALLLAFPAARNLAPSRLIHQLTRRGLEATRTVPEIVYALIFVWAFGVGPLAGILAIMIHTAGALGKLFAEVIENAEMQPWDGVRASGGNWAQACRYAILPQVAPNLLSYALLRFEINVRGASVIGFVGAGGIGQELYQVIAFNYYEEISAIVVLIILAVVMIDLLSERLRHRLITVDGAR